MYNIWCADGRWKSTDSRQDKLPEIYDEKLKRGAGGAELTVNSLDRK